jgi:hypothetical protein
MTSFQANRSSVALGQKLVLFSISQAQLYYQQHLFL